MAQERLHTAFLFTRETHSETFERFANAFLVPTYPELAAVGLKKDQAIDARVVCGATGKATLVVQSCVSPKESAPGEDFADRRGLAKNGHSPTTLAYCTPAAIGLDLDELKADLRRDRGITLEIHDGPWFVQHCAGPARSDLATQFADAVLMPLLRNVDPDRLYSDVLSDDEYRLALQYLQRRA